MKRIILLLPLAALLLFAAGCARKGGDGFAADDLSLTVGGKVWRCGDDIQTVIAALGEGYLYSEGKSCAYDGLDKTFAYEAAQFFTNPLEEGDMVSEIYTESPEAATSKGLAVGAARSAVVGSYGEPSREDNGLLVYRVSEEAGEPALCFDLEGETVVAIFLTREQI